MLLAPAQVVDAGVVDDAVEPGLERGIATETRQRAERTRIRLLEDIVHAVAVAKETECKATVAHVVSFDELDERFSVHSAGSTLRELVRLRDLVAHCLHIRLDAIGVGFLRATSRGGR